VDPRMRRTVTLVALLGLVLVVAVFSIAHH
jgi:uncharacterized membrane protein